jgi:ribosomal protein L30/L7E
VADLGVYYLDETTGAWVLVPGAVFNPATGSVSFYVNHLSKFAVLEKKSAGTAVIPPVIATPATSNFVLSEKGLVTTVNKALVDRLSGRILLQIELHGEAWYVNPVNSTKYFLGRPADAFAVMRKLGLGISTKNFDSYNGKAPARLAGRILLKVEDHGEAYYVNPVDLKMHFLGRPADAFSIMRSLGLGITNTNLRQITVSEIK